jgi:hypothetical protein
MPVDDWWRIVMGSGLRRGAADLAGAVDSVRDDNEAWARESNLSSIVIDANYATAKKPA